MNEIATQEDRFAGRYSTPFLSHVSIDSTWQLNLTHKYCNRIDRCSKVQLYQRSRSMQFQVLANPSLLVGLLTRRDMGREIATMSFARYPFSLLDSGHPSMFLGELWLVAWNWLEMFECEESQGLMPALASSVGSRAARADLCNWFEVRLRLHNSFGNWFPSCAFRFWCQKTSKDIFHTSIPRQRMKSITTTRSRYSIIDVI